MPTIKLEVISPDAVVYQADIDMLVVRSQAGELGILPHHMPMIAGILPCAMRVKLVDREELIAVAGGFMEVQRPARSFPFRSTNCGRRKLTNGRKSGFIAFTSRRARTLTSILSALSWRSNGRWRVLKRYTP